MTDPREYFKDLHDASAEPVQWIIEPWLPVGLQIVGGEPKSFKSMVVDSFPAYTAGWKIDTLPKWTKLAEGMKGPSILVSGEATAGELAWLYRAGFRVKTEESTIFVNDDPWDFKLDRQGTLNALLDMLNNVQPRICIVDPLRKFHSGDENDAAYVESILYPLRRWAVANAAAIIVVHHARKAAAGQDAEQIMDPSNLRGSNAIFGAADSIIMCRCIDRDIGRVRVAAIHKRASGWTRDLLLGVPGIPGWQLWGTEFFSDMDRNVERLSVLGGTVEQIAKQTRLKIGEVQEALDKFKRCA